MSKTQIKEFLVYRVKQKVRLYRKLKDRKLCPRWISYRTLKTERDKFDRLISKLTDEIKRFQLTDALTVGMGTVQLSGFRLLSYNGDFLGKVIEKDGHIYRGIYKESCSYFERLWKSGILQVLALHGYIPETSITDYFTEEYPIIIEHQRISISSSKMWNYEMIKDACIMMTVIQRVCNAFGFKLHDGHLNNITFDNGRCVFIDIGSFVVDDGLHLGQSLTVVFAGLYRLLFWNLDNSILKRIQVYDEKNNEIWIAPMYYDTDALEYKHMRSKFMRYHVLHSAPLYNLLVQKIFYLYDVRPEYISILFNNKNLREEKGAVGIMKEADRDIKEVISGIKKIIPEIESCTDIGGNFGNLAEAIYHEFKVKVIAADYSDRDSEIAYCRLREKQIPINTFLYNYIYGADEESRNCVMADLVTAVDITNHAEIYQAWKVDSLINSISKLSKKYCCITCHESTDQEKGLSAVRKAFGNFFDICYEKEFDLSDGEKAVLLLGKRGCSKEEHRDNETENII